MSPNTVVIGGGKLVRDKYGNVLPGAEPVEVIAVDVQPVEQSELSDADKNARVEVLRVWLPAGTVVNHSDTITIRGNVYAVRNGSWDWSVHRRPPALAIHQPPVVVDVERAVG